MKNFKKLFSLNLLFLLFIFQVHNGFGQIGDDVRTEIQGLINDGKFKKAIIICDDLIAEDPQNVEAYVIKSDLLVGLESYDEALTALNDGLAENSEESQLYNQRGMLYQSYGKIEPALRDYKIGLKFAENDTVRNVLWLNQATAKSQKRDFQGAYDILQKCLAFDSTSLATLNNLAAVCDEVGKPELTEYYLLKIVGIDSSFIGGYINLGFMYQGRGEYEKSITFFNKALEIQPDEAYSFNNRSYSKLKMGDLKGALKDVNRSIELYPGNSYAYRNRALIYIEMNKMKKACEDLENALNQGFTQSYGPEVNDLRRKYCR
jgi:tetratricopeptide (TPR) repeat protein